MGKMMDERELLSRCIGRAGPFHNESGGEFLDRGYGKPVPADSSIMTPAATEQVANVVYVPYQCETSEQWEREAQLWQEQQKKLREAEERRGIDPFALPPISEQRH
jgi:hypothetical protein